jgi:hypothetical protein
LVILKYGLKITFLHPELGTILIAKIAKDAFIAFDLE